MKRAAPALVGYFLVALAGCIAYSLIRPVPVDLIAPFVVGYKLRAAVIMFVGFMPSLLISGILLGYALAFSKNADELVERWSARLLAFLKGAYVLCLACIAVYVLLSEGLLPAMKSRQVEAVARTADFTEFRSVAREAYDRSSYAEAELAARSALRIWPKNGETAALLDRILYAHAGAEKSAAGPKTGTPGAAPNNGPPGAAGAPGSAAEDSVPLGSTGMTVLEALDAARQAQDNLDFYNAHYYAMLAYRLAPGTDPNRAVAQRLASKAWNQITEGKDLLLSEPDRKLYETKRSGYEAIQNGDYLRAYYIFEGLRKSETESPGAKKDPDVARFLEVSRKGVLESFFFIDETVYMRLFESSRNVFFVIRRADGGTDAVSARGITWTRAEGKDLAYLRGFEYAHFGPGGRLKYQMSVPYAKMFSGLSPEGTNCPELILHAVDRGREGADIVPVAVSGTIPGREGRVLLLDMPWKDFPLVVSANRGTRAMSLPDLLSFSPRASRYGFSRVDFSSEILKRISDPFLMLILSVIALIFAWKYKLGRNTLFKAWWVLAIPLFPLLCFYAVETVRYLAGLFIVTAAAVLPNLSLPLVLAGLSVAFGLVSLQFFAQRSD